jgi:hypothetical protein
MARVSARSTALGSTNGPSSISSLRLLCSASYDARSKSACSKRSFASCAHAHIHRTYTRARPSVRKSSMHRNAHPATHCAVCAARHRAHWGKRNRVRHGITLVPIVSKTKGCSIDDSFSGVCTCSHIPHTCTTRILSRAECLRVDGIVSLLQGREARSISVAFANEVFEEPRYVPAKHRNDCDGAPVLGYWTCYQIQYLSCSCG